MLDPSLKRAPKKGRKVSNGKRGKLMLAGMRKKMQKMEITKQTRHRQPKVLEMPRECVQFLITS
jgi:hypothetical protein